MKSITLIGISSLLLATLSFSANSKLEATSSANCLHHDHDCDYHHGEHAEYDQKSGYHLRKICELKASGLSEPSFIPPGDYSNKRSASQDPTKRYPRAAKAVFELQFAEGVTEQTKTAAQYAADLWADILTTDVTVNVLVREESDDSEDTLASAYAVSSFPTPANSYLPEHNNPVVLANRLYKVDLLEGNPDIVVQINKDHDFYYGTDGNCPDDQHDLVTILLHELGHGLGYFDSISSNADDDDVTEPTARFGLSNGKAMAYDLFLTTELGFSLVRNKEVNVSTEALYEQVTSNKVYFKGPLVMSQITGHQLGAQIYAPREWSAGSSISHLDETSFRAGTEHSLMTPFNSEGEVVHDPGSITIALLGDLGWDTVTINHTRPKDSEDLNAIITFDASVEADSPIEGPATLHYRNQSTVDSDGDGIVDETPFQSLAMGPTAVENQFTLPLQMSGIATQLEYYISVAASGNRTFTQPIEGAKSPQKIGIGTDTTPPTIAHIPDSYHLSNRQIVSITASADDNISVGGIDVEFWLDETLIGTVAAQQLPDGQWLAQVGMPDMSQSTAVRYKFIARDTSIAQNVAIFPAEGLFNLPIEQIYPTATSYRSTIDSAPDDFILNGFEVKQLAGFASQSLGTRHPYRNNGDEINYYAYMRQPILIQSGMKMMFDQIVLVEPGEDDGAFGTSDFYDYCVVEASGDKGRTWTPIADGWDSRINADWLAKYNDGIPEGSQNSSTTGTADMFRQHTINFDESEILSPGTEVMLRFRLHSDPYAVGWGWEIDNIIIGL